MDTSLAKKLQNVNQRLTHYQCQRDRYLHRKGQTASQFRKARTRTLIQLGGLIEKVGLLEPLNIALGDDLQRDYGCLESAAILAGALSELHQSFYEEDAEAQKLIWCERGKTVLGM